MESVLLTCEEHKILTKYKSYLESAYSVLINIPNSNDSTYCENDIIFASLSGNNIPEVKNFLSKKMNDLNESRSAPEADIPIIVLSDSEPETSPVAQVKKNKRKRNTSRRFKRFNHSQCSSTVLRKEKKSTEDNTNQVSSTTNEFENKKLKVCTSTNFQPVSMAVLTSTQNVITESSTTSVGHSSSSPIEKDCVSNQAVAIDDSVIVLDEDECIQNSGNDSVIILDSDIAVIPLPNFIATSLRPIIIDGSNVARAHGITTNTFSSKGIQISIDYFLKRGHQEVRAFVPHFRKHKMDGPFPTTDPHILEELSLMQHVIFTPSRSYDDRMIVEFAAMNEGVVLSNDNYRDLEKESAAWKEVIQKRLLKFCFVGDIIMIPKDPYGRHGPSLDDLLRLPSK